MGGSPPLRWVGSRHHPLITSFQATINYPSVSIIVTILAASPTIMDSLTTCISLRPNTRRSKKGKHQKNDVLQITLDPPLPLDRTDVIEITTFEHWLKICIQIILYHCRFRDFRCSIMVGSVLGRNLKDRPVFGQKKVEECQCRSKARQGGGVTDGEKLPPRLLPRLVLCDQCAPLVQPGLTRLPRRLFHKIFLTPGIKS